MAFQRIAFLAVSLLTVHVHGQPSIEADKDDLVLTGADITFASENADFPNGQITVAEMYKAMTDMQETVNDLKEQNAAQAGTIDTLEKSLTAKINGVTTSVEGNTQAITKTQKTSAANLGAINKNIDGMNTALTKLDGKPAITTCSTISVTNSKLVVGGKAQDDFNNGLHVVGLRVEVKCADGRYASLGGKDADAKLACFPSSKYCPAAGYPEGVVGANGVMEACHDDMIPSCETCMTECATCSAKDSCDTCKSNLVWSGALKKCMAKNDLPTSCKKLNDIKTVSSGQEYDLDVPKPIGKMTTAKALCLVDGNNVFTHIKCDALTSATLCDSFKLVTDENTCKEAGYIFGPMARSRAHFELMMGALDTRTMNKYHETVGSIYSDMNGPGHSGWSQGSSNCAMNSESTCSPAILFKTIDSGAWWMQDVPQSTIRTGGENDKRAAEPSGDYAANGLMFARAYGQQRDPLDRPRFYVGEGVRWHNDGADGDFNSGNVVPRYISGTFYMCTTSDYNA